MKFNLKTILSIGICVLLAWSCKKYTYDEALPQVQFVSAASNGSDSILLTGKVVSQGASAIENVGFAYSEQPNFDIMSNQIGGNLSGSTFSIEIPVMPDSTYYIKCFATNSYGYTATTNSKYTVPAASPQTAPCAGGSVKLNSIVEQGNTFSVTYNTVTSGGSFSSVGLQCSQNNFSNPIVTIYFNATPVNGVYRIIDPNNLSGDTNPYDCGIEDYNYNTSSTGSGYVYIAVGSGTGKSTVSFCNVNLSVYSISGYATY